MSQRSLEDLLRSTESPVELLRNSQAGPNVYPGVPAGIHQLARRAAGLAADLRPVQPVVPHGRPGGRGPGRAEAALAPRASTASRASASTGRSSSCPCTPDGYVIGDVILFHLAENRFNLVGRAPALNWITYHAETGGYDVQVELDERWPLRTDGRRRSYRFQVQGPNAMKVIEKLLGGPPPELKFFHMTAVTIAGKRSARCATAWPASRASSCSGHGTTRPRARGDRRGRQRIRAAPGRRPRVFVRTRSSRAGFPRRCPRSTRATDEGVPPVAAGERATRARRRSAAASSPTASRTTTSRRGTSATGATSSSTTTSSAARRSRRWPTASTATRSRSRSTTTTSSRTVGTSSRRPSARSSSSSRRPCTRCTRSTR